MPSLFDPLLARLAYYHAQHTYQRFQTSLRRVEMVQEDTLQRALAQVAESEFGRAQRLNAVRSVADFRRAVPLRTYEDLRPYLERVYAGEVSALFSPGRPILMFATTSGTTAKPKLVPVTPQFVRDYRRGWNTFGLKMLTDHPQAILRHILQSSSRHDSSQSPAGVPCGAITGLLAKMQKGIVRRFYIGTPEIAHIADSRARHYALMRMGIGRDVAFAITANPATLIQMARTADEESERLIRDVQDGTLCSTLVPDARLRQKLEAGLRPNRPRAADLAKLRAKHGRLLPRDYWNLKFLACWTGGSMGHYLQRLAEWYGPLPVRDIGLLASEGRVTIPLRDGTPAGVLDISSAFFEFIPIEENESAAPATLTARELEIGRDYTVVLTNRSGLIRYRLNDVVRVRGWIEQAPLLEFLYRAGRVASLTGEKLTENQVVAALQAVFRQFNLPELDFVMAPQWADPPFYRLNCPASPLETTRLAEAVDIALCQQNEEYESRRNSGRLQAVQIRIIHSNVITAMDSRLIQSRISTSEQYKRPCLLTNHSEDEQLLFPKS